MHRTIRALLPPLLLLAGCRHLSSELSGDHDPIPPPPPPAVRATFVVTPEALPSPTTFIVYGDMRFTSPTEVEASRPAARQALVARVAAEQPAALFLTGDVPFHGVSEDYQVFREESREWRRQQLRVYPALGNHEFYQCAVPVCLDRWWTAFPELHGRRWYSVALGTRLEALMLDSNAPLTPGSEQREWIEEQLGGLDARVQVVLIVMHHPPLAEPVAVPPGSSSGGPSSSHAVRPNEAALAEYLEPLAGQMSARIVVVSGHIHNYERFERGGVTYLVSGGGGAKPYPVERTPADRYQDPDFPNFHYLRFELRARTLVGEMHRLEVGPDGRAGGFAVRDRFELSLAAR